MSAFVVYMHHRLGNLDEEKDKFWLALEDEVGKMDLD
jgi:hypothetical protein